MSRVGRDKHRSQRGHLMAAVVVAVALLNIFSAVAVQEWAEVLRRDDEAEMIFRAQEIVRAIQRYRKAHGAPPQKLEQLMEPGPQGQYFLRHPYEDPLVDDGQWGLLYVGPGNTVIDPNAEEQAGGPGGLGRAGGQGGLGRSGQDRDRGSTGDSLRDRMRDRRQQQQSSRGRLLSADDPRSGIERMGAGGEEAGLPIAGVKSLCEEKPFRLYNGLPEYRQWLFTFFDLEMQQLPGQQRRQPGATGPGGRPRSPLGTQPGAGPGSPGRQRQPSRLQQGGRSPASLQQQQQQQQGRRR